ncbi:MAG: glycoside hydrolase family protein [Planctomycetota bacterium]|jgi:hypothetical protein
MLKAVPAPLSASVESKTQATADPRLVALAPELKEDAGGDEDDEEKAVKLVPKIAGDWWDIASNPDLGDLSTPKQQPVDFAIWQDNTGAWRVWSCIRHTAEPGKTRLLYGWTADDITDTDWEPTGVMLQADPHLGETPGGLQAPYVMRHDDGFLMFYGDWQNIVIAESPDGVRFKRIVKRGIAGVFGDGPRDNTRDPMVIKIGRDYYCYYTKHPDGVGAVYCRTSRNLEQWSFPYMVSFGGRAGMKITSYECPHVVEIDGYFYLFVTSTSRAPASSARRTRWNSPSMTTRTWSPPCPSPRPS